MEGEMKKEQIKIYGNTGLANRVARYNEKASEHRSKQRANPFSDSWQMSQKVALSKNDPNYGRPVAGSKTEYRGIKAGQLVNSEVLQLCDMIWEFGEQSEDGIAWIQFGELFEMYTRISNKLVGMLMRARKHGLLDFEGEMLFQRRDDHVIIQLIQPIEEIREAAGIRQPNRALARDTKSSSTSTSTTTNTTTSTSKD